MSNRNDGPGVAWDGNEVTLSAYTDADVMTALKLALILSHHGNVPSPLCCVAAASLLMTAAEMILRGPAGGQLSDCNEAALRQQAVQTADLLNLRHGPHGRAH